MFRSGAPWQQRPLTPPNPTLQQQQPAYHYPPAAGAYQAPQPPQPPLPPPCGPGYVPGYEQGGPCGVFPASSAGFDSHAAAFGPPGAAAGGYASWHPQPQPQPQQQPYMHASQQASALGMLALQHLQHMANQSKQHRAAASAAASRQGYNGYPANPMQGYAKPPTHAGVRHAAPPPPPRTGMPQQGCNPHSSYAQQRRPQSAYYPGSQRPGYAGDRGPYAGGQPGGYTGFGSRFSSSTSSTWQGHEAAAAAAAAGSEMWREEYCSSSGGNLDPHNPVLASLPRSSSALWEPSFNSPRCSNSNSTLRKSSSCDSIQRLCADAAAAAPQQRSTPGRDDTAAAALGPRFLAIAGAIAGAAMAGSGGATSAGGSPATLSSWLSPRSRGSPEVSSKAGMLTAAKDDTSTGQDDTGVTFVAAAPLVKAANMDRANSSGGGSLFGRLSNRSLAWDPLSTLSSGGGAKPPAAGARGVAAGSSGKASEKKCAVAAKVPLIYTPAAMLGQGMWGSGASAGGSGGFGVQMMPDQLDEMFRRLRAGVRGPDARPI